MKIIEITIGVVTPFYYNNTSYCEGALVYYLIPYCEHIKFKINNSRHFSEGWMSTKNGLVIDLLTKPGFNIDLEFDKDKNIIGMAKYGRDGNDIDFLIAYSFMQKFAQAMLELKLPTKKIVESGLELVAQDTYLKMFDKITKEGKLNDSR